MLQLTIPDPAADTRKWWALGVLCLSLVVVTVDTTILNVALPTLVDSLRASSSAPCSGSSTDTPWCSPASCSPRVRSATDSAGAGALATGLVVFGAASAASALAARTRPSSSRCAR